MAGKSVPLEGQEARPDIFLLSFCPDFAGSNALDQAQARQMIDSACRLPCAVSGCNDTMPTKSRDGHVCYDTTAELLLVGSLSDNNGALARANPL